MTVPDPTTIAEDKLLAVFQSQDGETVGPSLQLPASTTPAQLQLVLNQILGNEEPLPYSFFVGDDEIVTGIHQDILTGPNSAQRSTEDLFTITFQPQAIFRVRAVTRCSSTLTGHTEAVLALQFTPDGKYAASASGDTTVRIWDLNTETPKHTCKAHTNWVLCLAWSPDGKMLASGGMDNLVCLWNGQTGELVGTLRGHTKWVTSLSWEPFHLNPKCVRLVSSSKDGTCRIWNSKTKKCDMILSQHTDAVTCAKWGGEGLIYTASRDRTIKVWDSNSGTMCKTLVGHAHWVNTMALSTDYALRAGPYAYTGIRPASDEESVQQAKERFEAAKTGGAERMVTGSDDFTMFLWEPTVSKKSIARLTGHQQLVNHVTFSPDGRYIASASFDKSIKLWDGKTGRFITSLRGHVSPVYQVAFSGDSRMLLSGSKDSTVKVWEMRTKKLMHDLPGHADEVFTVDWSPTGESRALSGGKDRCVKFWRQ